VRQGEVAAGADLDVLKVEAVDSEEVGIDVFFVVEDPQEFLDPFDDGVPEAGFFDLGEELDPRGAVVYFAFPSCFFRRPRARSRTLLTIHSIWSSVSARDCSSAS